MCLPPSRRLYVMAMSALCEIDAPIYVSLREGSKNPGQTLSFRVWHSP